MESYSMFFPAPSSDLHLYQPNKNTAEMVPNSLFYTNMSLDDQIVSNQDHEEGKMASSSGGHDGSVPKVVTGVKAGSEINKKKVRKPRYAFQTRSHVDILDDGYRWRKYGQKAVKNNKFPRSYYKCTQQGCDVKKQVQRLSKDEEVVVTTYEGMHTHPIAKSSDNFEQILRQMQIYSNF